jgi:hypothetical protein
LRGEDRRRAFGRGHSLPADDSVIRDRIKAARMLRQKGAAMTTSGANRSIADVLVCVAAGQGSVRRLPAFRSSKPPPRVYVKGEAFDGARRAGRTLDPRRWFIGKRAPGIYESPAALLGGNSATYARPVRLVLSPSLSAQARQGCR